MVGEGQDAVSAIMSKEGVKWFGGREWRKWRQVISVPGREGQSNRKVEGTEEREIWFSLSNVSPDVYAVHPELLNKSEASMFRQEYGGSSRVKKPMRSAWAARSAEKVRSTGLLDVEVLREQEEKKSEAA